MTQTMEPAVQTTSAAETHPAPAAPVAHAATGGWVVVIGGSSAIGRAVARQWAASGSDVILAGRDIDDLKITAADLKVRHACQVEVVAFDAMKFDAHASFWQDCQARAGGAVQGVVLLYGQLPSQTDAQADFAVARQAIDVNFTSAAALLSIIANDFEAKKQGFLCVFSSVAGDRGRQSNYIYGAAKAALTAFVAGLRNRLFKSHVTVVTVKPGFVDTAMTWGLPGLFLVATPERVANDAYRAVKRRRAVIYTPWFWRYIMMMIKMVPENVFKRMKM